MEFLKIDELDVFKASSTTDPEHECYENVLCFSSFPVCFQSFQKSVGKDEAMPDSLRNLIFANFEPVYKFHETFLNDVEQRLAQWCVYEINVFVILECVQTFPTVTDTRLDLSFSILIRRLMPFHLLVE